jgi:hypothetical protein
MITGLASFASLVSVKAMSLMPEPVVNNTEFTLNCDISYGYYAIFFNGNAFPVNTGSCDMGSITMTLDLSIYKTATTQQVYMYQDFNPIIDNGSPHDLGQNDNYPDYYSWEFANNETNPLLDEITKLNSTMTDNVLHQLVVSNQIMLFALGVSLIVIFIIIFLALFR